jgi:ACT domain-containing protein
MEAQTCNLSYLRGGDRMQSRPKLVRSSLKNKPGVLVPVCNPSPGKVGKMIAILHRRVWKQNSEAY